MKSSCLLDVLVVVAVIFCFLKVSVSHRTSEHGQDGDRVSRVTLSPDSILLLRSSALATQPPGGYCDFPDEIKLESNSFEQTKRRKRKGHRGGLRRKLRKA